MQSNTFSGLFIGQKIITLARVASTNDFLKEQLSNSKPFPEGTAIMAEIQTAGRGQAGSIWLAEPGANLTCSILLQPTFLRPSEQFWINIVVCNGICQALQHLLGEDIRIKWPNDLLFRNQKIAGVLIENILQGSTWKHSIIGIGVNVNQEVFPEELHGVTSIRQILHQTYSKEKLLSEICLFINQTYGQLKAGKLDELKTFYLNNLFAKAQKQRFLIDGVEVQGVIRDVEVTGQLLVDFQGQHKTFGFKEIAFIL